jgi:alkylhydroperoxidase/carboxymuconolactone decarboxylase family protein YurZ
MPKKTSSLPTGAGRLATRHPQIWERYTELGEECADSGPLDAHTRRLVKIALATGAGLEGAVHSHMRRGLKEGITADEFRHVTLLAIPTLGLPSAIRAMTWMDDILGAVKQNGSAKAKPRQPRGRRAG